MDLDYADASSDSDARTNELSPGEVAAASLLKNAGGNVEKAKRSALAIISNLERAYDHDASEGDTRNARRHKEMMDMYRAALPFLVTDRDRARRDRLTRAFGKSQRYLGRLEDREDRELLKSCMHCGARGTWQACDGCGVAHYCSKDHQLADQYLHDRKECVHMSDPTRHVLPEDIAVRLEDAMDDAVKYAHVTDDDLEVGELLINTLDPWEIDGPENIALTVDGEVPPVDLKYAQLALDTTRRLENDTHVLTSEQMALIRAGIFDDKHMSLETLHDAMMISIENATFFLGDLIDEHHYESVSDDEGDWELDPSAPSPIAVKALAAGDIPNEDHKAFIDTHCPEDMIHMAHLTEDLQIVADRLWDAMSDETEPVPQELIKESLEALRFHALAIGRRRRRRRRRKRKGRRRRKRKRKRRGRRKKKGKKKKKGKRGKRKKGKKRGRKKTRKGKKSKKGKKKSRKGRRKKDAGDRKGKRGKRGKKKNKRKGKQGDPGSSKKRTKGRKNDDTNRRTTASGIKELEAGQSDNPRKQRKAFRRSQKRMKEMQASNRPAASGGLGGGSKAARKAKRKKRTKRGKRSKDDQRRKKGKKKKKKSDKAKRKKKKERRRSRETAGRSAPAAGSRRPVTGRTRTRAVPTVASGGVAPAPVVVPAPGIAPGPVVVPPATAPPRNDALPRQQQQADDELYERARRAWQQEQELRTQEGDANLSDEQKERRRRAEAAFKLAQGDRKLALQRSADFSGESQRRLACEVNDILAYADDTFVPDHDDEDSIDMDRERHVHRLATLRDAYLGAALDIAINEDDSYEENGF